MPRWSNALNIAELKVWHWTLIGAVIGLALALRGPGTSHDRTADKVRTITQQDLEDAILHTSADGPSSLTSIVVHPKVGSQGYWVTGSWTHPIRVHEDPANHRSRLVTAQMTLPVKFLAPDPYHAINPKLANGKSATVFAALDAARRLSDGQSPAYRYAWQEQPMLAGCLWIAGSIALVGGIWPAVLGFLIGAGFGPINQDSGFGDLSCGPADKLRQKKAEARVDELLDSIAEYEAELGLADEGAPPTLVAVATAPAIRQLGAGPLEQAQAPPADADKDFGGEFYPTEVHHDPPVDT
jgi:hypothetical protein